MIVFVIKSNPQLFLAKMFAKTLHLHDKLMSDLLLQYKKLSFTLATHFLLQTQTSTQWMS